MSRTVAPRGCLSMSFNGLFHPHSLQRGIPASPISGSPRSYDLVRTDSAASERVNQRASAEHSLACCFTPDMASGTSSHVHDVEGPWRRGLHHAGAARLRVVGVLIRKAGPTSGSRRRCRRWSRNPGRLSSRNAGTFRFQVLGPRSLFERADQDVTRATSLPRSQWMIRRCRPGQGSISGCWRRCSATAEWMRHWPSRCP